jgi:hypothetical protein
MKSKGDEFYRFEEIDGKVFIWLMKKSQDFLKLDDVDRNVLIWLVNKSPKKLRSWVEYLASDYKRKSVKINSVKLYNEVRELL